MDEAIADSGRFRLVYMDGLRGLLAATITLIHLYLRMIDWPGASRRLAGWPKLGPLGHCVVTLFVVLSGYSLMLPVARTADHRLAGGWRRYAMRRSRRILPAYYASLFFSILPLLPGWIGWPRFPWSGGAVGTPVVISGSSLIAHVLMIQNLRGDWAQQINGPLWSIATECQLYVVFPLLLLPLWRGVGSLWTVLLSVAAGSLIGVLTGMRFNACPWYVGIFSMGMAASVIGFAKMPSKEIAWARRIAWRWICAVLLAIAVGLIIALPLYLPLTDLLIGLSGMALLIACTARCQSIGRRNLLLNFLESKPLVGLGVMSYSLYLIHGPMINVVATLLSWLLGANVGWWLMTPATVVLVGAATVLFYQVFERPFGASAVKANEGR